MHSGSESKSPSKTADGITTPTVCSSSTVAITLPVFLTAIMWVAVTSHSVKVLYVCSHIWEASRASFGVMIWEDKKLATLEAISIGHQKLVLVCCQHRKVGELAGSSRFGVGHFLLGVSNNGSAAMWQGTYVTQCHIDGQLLLFSIILIFLIENTEVSKPQTEVIFFVWLEIWYLWRRSTHMCTSRWNDNTMLSR